MNNIKVYDVAIIGGGFYGCVIALYLKNIYKNIVLIEKETKLLSRASYNNQARIHNGYHYPRSFVTALRSHTNYTKFISDFKSAVVSKHLMVYAIAAGNSKVNSRQFQLFCKQIGSPITKVPESIKKLFNESLIEDAFLVEEKVFNAAKLRYVLKNKLLKNKIKIVCNTEVSNVKPTSGSIKVNFSKGDFIKSKIVINCAYSNINTILKNSNLPLLPLKQELAEMPLIKLPPPLSNMGITIMDGSFFSIMPFPDKKLHTIHHVRYTPHDFNLNGLSSLNVKQSKYLYMIKDIERYIPSFSKAKYKSSIYETKTILFQNEINDARPILFKKNYKIKNFHIILGGKIDNIYDVVEKIEKYLLRVVKS